MATIRFKHLPTGRTFLVDPAGPLVRRNTVTFKQLTGLFDGSFEFVAASRAGADGRRPLDKVVPDRRV